MRVETADGAVARRRRHGDRRGGGRRATQARRRCSPRHRRRPLPPPMARAVLYLPTWLYRPYLASTICPSGRGRQRRGGRRASRPSASSSGRRRCGQRGVAVGAGTPRARRTPFRDGQGRARSWSRGVGTAARDAPRPCGRKRMEGAGGTPSSPHGDGRARVCAHVPAQAARSLLEGCGPTATGRGRGRTVRGPRGCVPGAEFAMAPRFVGRAPNRGMARYLRHWTQGKWYVLSRARAAPASLAATAEHRRSAIAFVAPPAVAAR